MDRRDLKAGALVVGDLNSIMMKILEVKEPVIETESGRERTLSTRVVLEDLYTGRVVTVGLGVLRKAHVNIVQVREGEGDVRNV